MILKALIQRQVLTACSLVPLKSAAVLSAAKIFDRRGPGEIRAENAEKIGPSKIQFGGKIRIVRSEASP